MISLIAKNFVFFLLEWPYKESLKLISQGTQLLYIWNQASEQKNQAFMEKGIKHFPSTLHASQNRSLQWAIIHIPRAPQIRKTYHLMWSSHNEKFQLYSSRKQILRILAEGISRDLFTRQIMVRWCICPTNAIRAPDLWHLDLALRSLLSWLRPPEAGGRA